MLVNMVKMIYKSCFGWYINMELRNGFGQRFYDMIMMYICCYDDGEAWYDVIMLELDWYKHGKHEK